MRGRRDIKHIVSAAVNIFQHILKKCKLSLTPFLLLMFEETERAQAMLDAGAVCYLTKSGAAEALITAVRKHGARQEQVIN